MSGSKSAKFKKHSVVTKRRWRFESGTESRVRNYTSFFPSYLRSKTPKVTWTLTNAVISSFSDGLTGLLLEDKLIENLHVDRTCNIAEYCFCQYPRRKVSVCMYILVKTFRGMKMCFFYNGWTQIISLQDGVGMPVFILNVTEWFCCLHQFFLL